jgi:small subunit ribosomal protein S17
MARTLTGIVSSSKADKTIVVTIQTRKTHPVYRKQFMVSQKFMAHDEKNEAQTGDKVEIVETRPLSARKHHRLSRIIERPALREDTLAATKVEEPEKPAKKAETEAEDSAPKEAAS